MEPPTTPPTTPAGWYGGQPGGYQQQPGQYEQQQNQAPPYPGTPYPATPHPGAPYSGAPYTGAPYSQTPHPGTGYLQASGRRRTRSTSSLVAGGSALLAAVACLVSLLFTFWHYRSGQTGARFDFDINAFGTYKATTGHNPFVGHDTRYGIELAVLGGLLLIAAVWALVSTFAPYVVMTAAAAGTVAIAAEVLLDMLSRHSYDSKDFSQSAGPGVYLVFVAGVLALIAVVFAAVRLSGRRTAG